MESALERVRGRVRAGIAYIHWTCGLVGLERIDPGRVNTKDYERCPLALATGLRYAIAVEMCKLSWKDEVRYAFTIDPTERDIFFEDLTDMWREEISTFFRARNTNRRQEGE